jgi:hypothetical protein
MQNMYPYLDIIWKHFRALQIEKKETLKQDICKIRGYRYIHTWC